MTSPSNRRRRARPGLGTLVDITIDEADEARAEAAFNSAFAAVERIHRLMSAHEAGSDVSRLSEGAHRHPVAVDAETAAVLRLAVRLHAASNGLFDVAVGEAMARGGRIPPLADAARASPGRSDEIVLHADGSVGFGRAMHIDLGGIAKGHAVDLAVEALRELGITAALVNAGGDMRAFGAAAHPVQLRFPGGLRTVALLADAALASSGPAPDDAAAPHIDPRSGRGVRLRHSVMVQAPTAALADALTKVALLCPATADRLCAQFGAEWRGFDFR